MNDHASNYQAPSPQAFAEMLADAISHLDVSMTIDIAYEPGTDPNALAAFHLSGAVTATAMMIYNEVMQQSTMPTNHLSGASWARGFHQACVVQSVPDHPEQLETREGALYTRIIHQAAGFYKHVATTKRASAIAAFLDAAHALAVADRRP